MDWPLPSESNLIFIPHPLFGVSPCSKLTSSGVIPPISLLMKRLFAAACLYSRRRSLGGMATIKLEPLPVPASFSLRRSEGKTCQIIKPLAAHSQERVTTKICENVAPSAATLRMKATEFPSGENPQAKGNGASAPSRRGVRRVVRPSANSVTHTLPSIPCAMRRPSGLHVNADETPVSFRVTCRGTPPPGDTVQSCTTPASSFRRNAICAPSGEARNQCRGTVATPGNF